MKTKVFLFALLVANIALTLFVWHRQNGPTGNLPAVIRAQQFELVDAQGRLKGQLYLGQGEGGNLRLYSGKGEIRVKLGPTAEDGAGFLLMDESTEPGALLYSSRKGSSLQLNGEGKAPLIMKP